MSSQSHTPDPTLRRREQKAAFHDRRLAHVFRRVLHILEYIIATLTLLALLIALGLEVYKMLAEAEHYFADVEHMLHNLLTIVVGMEFVRMLIDTTPANILEVLTVAITRHVILSHDDPISNVACIACIAGLFAIRRFLIPKDELQEEMVEVE